MTPRGTVAHTAIHSLLETVSPPMRNLPPPEVKSICVLCPVQPLPLDYDSYSEWIRATVTESTPF
jgi:hypothetical protein